MSIKQQTVMSRPDAILQAQQFAKRLWQDAGKLITDVGALKQQRVPAARIAMYLATEHPSIKLIGVLLQLAPENRLPVLTGDGGLTLEQARAALQPVERLQHDPKLRQALAQVMPSRFSFMQERKGRGALMTKKNKQADTDGLSMSEAALARWAGRPAGCSFGQKLRERREALGWSQGRLGEVLGVTRERVSAIEKGPGEPSLRTARAIADALGCQLSDLT